MIKQTVKIKIFWCFLFISLAEALLWALPICEGGVDSRIYYHQQTGNFKSTAGSVPHFEASGFHFHGFELAAKVELKATRQIFLHLVALFSLVQGPGSGQSIHHFLPGETLIQSEDNGTTDGEAAYNNVVVF